MKKYFYTALIAGTILAGASSLTAQATKPTTEQSTKSEEKNSDVEQQNIEQTTTPEQTEEQHIAPVDDDKATGPAAVVSSSTMKETEPDTVDMTITPELQRQTLEKFAKLSRNLEPTREFTLISQLHSREEFGNPYANPELRTLTMNLAPNPEYMPIIEGLPIIPSTEDPFINASCAPSKINCRYILTANPINGVTPWGNIINTYPEYIKLLLHYRPKFIIAFVSDVQPSPSLDAYVSEDPEEYRDTNFSLTRSNVTRENNVISYCDLCLSKLGKPELQIKKFYILCEKCNNPTSSKAIVDLILQIKRENSTNLPIIIQSTSGNGRPSCLATMFLAYEELTKTDLTPVKSIPEILSDLSQMRCCTTPYFSKEQYLLIYNVVYNLACQIPYTSAVHNFLTHHKLDALSDAQTCCAICWENFADDDLSDRIIFPKCGHFFHKSCCTSPSGEKIMSCPICRREY